MKRKRIEINYKPLHVHVAINEVGSIASLQTYDAATGVYEADYTLTPLVLLPQCDVIDRDGIIKEHNINAKLINLKWNEIINGKKTLIESTNNSYEITQDGTNKGQIKVKKNAALLHPITLDFYAEYLDTRTNQIIVFKRTKLVKCINATDANPLLTLDSESTHLWNPWEDAAQQIITAKLMVGETDYTGDTAKRKFFWYKLRENGTLTLAGSDELDMDIISANDNVLVVDRDMMGEKQTYVCKATFSPTGSPAASPTDADSTATTTVVRRLPPFDYDIINIPNRIAPGTTVVQPKVIVVGPKGIISNAMQELRATWYKDNTVIGTGESPKLSAVDITSGLLGVEVVDKGNYKMLAVTDEKIITTNDGKAIITK